jgi:hypothetical protein
MEDEHRWGILSVSGWSQWTFRKTWDSLGLTTGLTTWKTLVRENTWWLTNQIRDLLVEKKDLGFIGRLGFNHLVIPWRPLTIIINNHQTHFLIINNQ